MDTVVTPTSEEQKTDLTKPSTVKPVETRKEQAIAPVVDTKPAVVVNKPVHQEKPISQKKKTNNKRANSRPSSFEIVTPTSAKMASYRKITLHNKQLENQLVYCDRITRSLMTITGSLVRCKKFDIQKEFDAYVDLLLLSFTESQKAILAKYEEKVASFEQQGYEFFESGRPGEIRVEVRSNHVANLIDLILLIDKCMTMAGRLEKTPALTPPELYDLYAEWIVIPRKINGRFMSVIDILDKKFRLKINARTDSKSTSGVEFDNVHQFMLKLRQDQEETKRVDIPAVLSTHNDAQAPTVTKKPPAAKLTAPDKSAVLVKDAVETVTAEEPKSDGVAKPNEPANEASEAKAAVDFLNWKVD